MKEGEAAKAIRTYRDLVAWQLGMDLAQMVFRLTGSFPKSEQYGMVAQMRRSAASVPANIAEGYGRGRKAEFRRFLEIARGQPLCIADVRGTGTAAGMDSGKRTGRGAQTGQPAGRRPGRSAGLRATEKEMSLRTGPRRPRYLVT